MKKLKTLFTIGVIFAMVFTVFPAFSGDMNAYAATPKKITLKVSSSNSYSVTLKWNKCKSPKKGYAVFRNGSCIKRLGTKTYSYKVSCRPGDSNTYQIKNWTSKKQYYNTKKKKWQNSQPKKSQWKGKKTRYKYTYSNASNSIAVANSRLSQSIFAMDFVPLSGYSTSNDILVDGNIVQVAGGTVFKITASSTSGGKLTFTSSNSGVASVDSSGIVTAKSKGSANITIKQGGTKEYNSASKTVRVDVTGKAQTINHGGNKSLNIGDNYKLNAIASSGLPLTYISENPNVATVDSTGKVHAVKTGRTNIQIRQEGNSVYSPKTVFATITVKSANITIKFEGNGKTSGSMNDQTLTNGTGILNSNTFIKTNYVFKGWDTNPNSTSPKWLNNGRYTQISDEPITVTLYAIWEKDNNPTVVTNPLTFSYSKQNSSGENVIDIKSENVPVTMNIPEGVDKITWSLVKVGLADGTNTITLNSSNNGKTLTLKANNALSNKNTLGQVKLKAVFEMKEGYIYYDKDGNGTPNEASDRTVTSSFVITNTVYPMEGNIASATWNYNVFGKNSVESGSIRKLDVFSELPIGSTVNININEWDDTAHGTVLALSGNDISLVTPEKDLDVIITRSKVPTSMRLVHAGTFQLAANNKIITFNLTGQNNDMVTYSNHLKSVANSCRGNTKYDTAMNCLAYVLTHYTYNESYRGMFPFDTSGQCNSGNTYYADLLRYCGIEAYVRNAQEYLSNHVVTGAILDNNTKYIIDATPNDYAMQDMNSALYYISGLVANSSSEWCRGMRVITWDDYYTHYSKFPGLSFYTDN